MTTTDAELDTHPLIALRRRYVSISRDESIVEASNLFVYELANGSRLLAAWSPLFISEWTTHTLDPVLASHDLARASEWTWTANGATAWLNAPGEVSVERRDALSLLEEAEAMG